MVLYWALLSADFEGVEKVSVADKTAFCCFIAARCAKCREPFPRRLYLAVQEHVAVPGSRGAAALVAACHFCKCTGNISFLDPPVFYDVVNGGGRLFQIDCRSIVPVEAFLGEASLAIESCSGTAYQCCSLEEQQAEWCDYDEKMQQQIGISNLKIKFTETGK